MTKKNNNRQISAPSVFPFLEEEICPFAHLSLKGEKTAKRAVGKNCIQELATLHLESKDVPVSFDFLGYTFKPGSVRS